MTTRPRLVDARSPARSAAPGPMRFGVAARGGALALALTAVFLTAGLPRWLAGDVDPVAPPARVDFSKLCRAHGGTPRPAPGSRGTAQVCTVRYGRRVYLMDAVTSGGFDADTARFQRQGCQEEARRDRRASSAAGPRRQAFVYHPDTGVCEQRP
jgi:hypothetical protein